MLASELIARLESIIADRGDIPVVVSGEDAGYDDPDTVHLLAIYQRGLKVREWEGAYTDYSSCSAPGSVGFTAVAILR